MASQTLRCRRKIVGGITGEIWQRNKSQYLRCDRTNWNGGLVWKGCPSRSVRVSGGRIVDNRSGATKVSGAKGGRRHGLNTRLRPSRYLAIIAFKGSVVASKEEQLVL